MMNRQSLSQYLLFNIMRFSQVEKCTKSILTSVGVQNSFYITLLGGSDWGKRDESGGSEMKNRDDRLGVMR
ncbi:hypothetical protein EYC84_006023 [Monilinia fructicola]|uniref:Uncharacterized protein n=1 Tax=Monilinia fructicola TaxID=38448 RepID=A0A5M9K356_MONFR|nr:hypothetical protein EYC84_006023 [Monilinia fructicola]